MSTQLPGLKDCICHHQFVLLKITITNIMVQRKEVFYNWRAFFEKNQHFLF